MLSFFSIKVFSYFPLSSIMLTRYSIEHIQFTNNNGIANISYTYISLKYFDQNHNFAIFNRILPQNYAVAFLWFCCYIKGIMRERTIFCTINICGIHFFQFTPPSCKHKFRKALLFVVIGNSAKYCKVAIPETKFWKIF